MSHRGWVVVIGIIWTAAACSSTSPESEDTSAEPASSSSTPANVEPGDSSASPTSPQVPPETTEPEPDPTSTRPGRRPDGLYEMGVHKFTVVDETRSTDEVRDRDERVVVSAADTRTIPVRVAYPAESAGDDTEPAGTGFPLVVYAHGVSSSGSGVPGYFQHLAEAGYVVVGPDFPETSRDARNSSDFVEQPADVSLVLDRLIERVSDPNDQIFELFDPERLAISGHSLGGLTAYALAFHDCCRDERFDVVLVYAAVYLFPEGDSSCQSYPRCS